MRPLGEQESGPPEFLEALERLRAVAPRPEVELAESPAPRRLAPHAAAVTADVVVDDDVETASGKLVLLYDPVGQDAWEGQWRIVVFCRATLEPEAVEDPLAGDVGWSWLQDAMSNHGAIPAALGGTVTRTQSHSFGRLIEQEGRSELELRASWTVLDGRPATHLEAWLELLCTMSGLEPLPEGVTRLRP